MSIYAIADLHLSFSENKPMDIFGENWEKHEQKVRENWLKKVDDDDLVVLPGDFSWAMHLKDAKEDFKFLDNLPGKKVLIKGNHDFWWTTLKSMNAFLEENQFESINFIYNNAINYENKIIVGTRGWTIGETENAEKMKKRELRRLENSILFAKENFKPEKEIICALHYPPITKNMVKSNEKSDYLELLKKYNIKKCIYGHLHGKAHEEAVEGFIENIELNLVSCDYLNFNLKLIDE